jgi:biotin carboxyl carrier protein
MAVDVIAEWPGRVAEIHVSVGDTVEPEQELLTLESMKMLTPITAPSSGRVAEIAVAIDDHVDEGALLARLGD